MLGRCFLYPFTGLLQYFGKIFEGFPTYKRMQTSGLLNSGSGYHKYSKVRNSWDVCVCVGGGGGGGGGGGRGGGK